MTINEYQKQAMRTANPECRNLSNVGLAKDKYGDKCVGLEIKIENDEEVTLTYSLKNDVPFERIRRITGYLVGTLNKWNDAKRAEEKDRVKHKVSQNSGN